jgi:hypothetical protein
MRFALSRTVILPDFQAMGLGVKLSEFACAIIKTKGGLCFTKTITQIRNYE